jgi:hypothetical protein
VYAEEFNAQTGALGPRFRERGWKVGYGLTMLGFFAPIIISNLQQGSFNLRNYDGVSSARRGRCSEERESP